jgi:hypothetical protein
MSSSSSISSKRSRRSFRDDNIIQSLLTSSPPRSQLISFSSDVDYVLCASTQHHGSIYKVLEPNTSSPVLKIGQPEKVTTVDWTTHSSNACLFGTIDGTVKVTSLIKA